MKRQKEEEERKDRKIETYIDRKIETAGETKRVGDTERRRQRNRSG